MFARRAVKAVQPSEPHYTGTVQYIAIDDLDWLFIERVSASHAMLAPQLRTIISFADQHAPESVLMLGADHRLEALVELNLIGGLNISDFHGIHALGFAPALAQQLWKYQRVKRFPDGRWLCTIKVSSRVPIPALEILDSNLLQPWFANVTSREQDDTTGWDAYETWRRLIKETRARREVMEVPSPVPVGEASGIRLQLRKTVLFVDPHRPWAAWRRDSDLSAALDNFKRNGRIFAVQEDNNHDLFPLFQFSEDAEPLPAMVELLASVPKEAQGWPLLSWFEACNVLLRNQKPSEVIAREPAAVVAAAAAFYSSSD